MASLWDALGRPPLEASVPPSRSTRWIQRRNRLRQALGETGRNAVRSAQALWSLAQQTTMPRGATWQQLCHDVTLDTIAARIPTPQTQWKLASWNARWLVDPHTHQSSHKRAVIREQLLLGTIVCLQ